MFEEFFHWINNYLKWFYCMLYILSLINITNSFPSYLYLYYYYLFLKYLYYLFIFFVYSWFVAYWTDKKVLQKMLIVETRSLFRHFAKENPDYLGNLQCMRSIFPSTATYPKFSYPPRNQPSYRFYVSLGNFAVR